MVRFLAFFEIVFGMFGNGEIAFGIFGNRVLVASICFLVIGFLAFVLVICMILFEDEWVEKIVAKFPKHSKVEVRSASKELPAIEIDLRNSKSSNKDQNADSMRKEMDGPSLVTKEDIGNSQSDPETV